VLEFSANQSAMPAPRDGYCDSTPPNPQVAGTFITPVSMVFDEATTNFSSWSCEGRFSS